MGRKRLSPSNGAGKKIMENLHLFNYSLENRDGSLYIFNVKFDETKGSCTVRLDDEGEIIRINLNMNNFKLSLPEYNDPTLMAVAKLMMKDIIY